MTKSDGMIREMAPAVEADRAIPRLARLLARAAATRRVRHVAIGAAAIDGSWDWSDAAGESGTDGSAMRPDTPWFLASVTKLYIAAVIMRLHEQGLIDLEASMSEYLPDDLGSGLHVTDGVDRTDRITVTHLLAHATGLPDSLLVHRRGGASLVAEIEAGDIAFTLAEAIGRIRSLAPHFPPSDLRAARPRVRYSETNFQLLMVIAEQVTGRPMSRLYAELLFGPLGLGETWFPGTAPPGVASPATPWLADWPLQDRPQALGSIGDLFSTTADVLRFGRALFAGEVFADPATAELMWRRCNKFGLPRSAAAIASPAWPIEYGLGMMRFAPSRLMAAGRRLPPLYGHTGSTASWLWLAPSLGLLLAGTLDQANQAVFPFRAVAFALAAIEPR